MSDEKAFQSQVESAIQETESFLQGQNYQRALTAAIANPPLKSKNADLKRKSSDNVLRVLALIKDSDIQSFVDGFDDGQCDLMMKYVCRGFENDTDHAGSLLRWHQALSEKAGIGCIIRAMTDKKSV